MNIERECSVAFTGYRTAKISSDQQRIHEIVGDIRRRLSLEISALVQRGYTTFLSGMAEGFDMLAAEEVIRLQLHNPTIKLIAVIPFAQQRQSLGRCDKTRYDNILSHASQQITLADQYHISHFFRRNDFLVDNCSHLICYYDGQNGGTRYTIERAHKSKIPITNIADSQSHLELKEPTLF